MAFKKDLIKFAKEEQEQFEKLKALYQPQISATKELLESVKKQLNILEENKEKIEKTVFHELAVDNNTFNNFKINPPQNSISNSINNLIELNKKLISIQSGLLEAQKNSLTLSEQMFEEQKANARESTKNSIFQNKLTTATLISTIILPLLLWWLEKK